MEARYFELLEVDVHSDVKSRYLRQVTEAAEEERAQFELQEKVKPHQGNTQIVRTRLHTFPV